MARPHLMCPWGSPLSIAVSITLKLDGQATATQLSLLLSQAYSNMHVCPWLNLPNNAVMLYNQAHFSDEEPRLREVRRLSQYHTRQWWSTDKSRFAWLQALVLYWSAHPLCFFLVSFPIYLVSGLGSIVSVLTLAHSLGWGTGVSLPWLRTLIFWSTIFRNLPLSMLPLVSQGRSPT